MSWAFASLCAATAVWILWLSVQLYSARCEHALSLLEQHGKLTGRQLVAHSNNTIPRYAVYVVLADLEHQGRVSSVIDPGDPLRRRIYSSLRYPSIDDDADPRKSGGV